MTKYLIKLSKEGPAIRVHTLKRAAALSKGRPFIARKIRRKEKLGPWAKYLVRGRLVRRQRRRG